MDKPELRNILKDIDINSLMKSQAGATYTAAEQERINTLLLVLHKLLTNIAGV